MSDVVIVGAGPSGLAMGACLRKADLPFVIFEQASSVANAWRSHYERLHLHTVKQHSALPYMDFPNEYPKYIPRDSVFEYMCNYAQQFSIAPRLDHTVTRVARSNGNWIVRANDEEIETENVVIASGYNRRPLMPEWPGRDTCAIPMVHSRDFLNGEPYEGKRVLVVGIGNTGAEIALDLHEHGAKPSIAVRGPINIVPRDALGTPAQVTGIMLEYLPNPLADALSNIFQRLFIGDLSEYGITMRKESPNADVRKIGRVPLIDIGTVDMIKSGALPVYPGIDHFTENEVHFDDGRAESFDAIVMATGYRPGLDDFLEGAEDLVDDRGYPKTLDGPALPGLYFLGYKNPPSGFLRQIALDAPVIARDIARRAH